MSDRSRSPDGESPTEDPREGTSRTGVDSPEGTDVDALPAPDAGLTYTTTATFGDVVLHEPATTASELWSQLVDVWTGAGLGGEIVGAVRELVAGATPGEARDRLEDVVDDALDGALVDVLLSLAGDDDDRWFWKAATTLTQLGSGRPLGFRSDLEDCRATLDLLAATGRSPTVTIQLPTDFRDVDARTRARWCELVSMLGQTCDVRLVCTGVDRAWLAAHHRDELPGVSDRWKPCREEGDTAAALDLVTTGSRHERVLSLLQEEDTETLAYSRLYSEFSVSRSRVRQVIGDLDDVDLVDAYGPSQKRRIELTPFGRQFYTEEIAVQQRLGERVSESGKLCNDSRVTPRTHGTGGDRQETAPPATADRHRLPAQHETRYASRRTAAAALGTAVESEISIVNYPVDPQDDRAEGRWHYDDGQLVVTAEGDNPMQLWTTLALALASPRTFEAVLTRGALEDHGVLDMLQDGEAVLRGMRNIGWLPDEVDSYDELREALLDAADELGELTKEYHETQDDALRSTITRHALGLAGTVTHLLDLVDVEFERVVKFPEFSRRFDADRREQLFRSLAVGSAIGSRYGHHVAYRQLFESRDEKRVQAFSPTVDAADPWARLVGSWTLVGDFAGQVDDVADSLRTHFHGLDVHEDAPEMAIRTSIRTEPTRRQVAETARRMLATKELRLTPEATSVLHAVARTPRDVADALEYLGDDNDWRRVDAAEIRYALSQLDSGRLLRGFDGRTTTPRRILSVLLEADRPLSGEEIDERAGVSRRSRNDHLDDMEAAGLVTAEDDEYRLRLSFRDVDDEDTGRYSSCWPAYVADPEISPKVHAAAKALRVGREHHGPGDPVDDPGWGVGGVSNPPDPRQLSRPWPYLDDVLPALWGVRERDSYSGDLDVAPAVSMRRITSGPPVQQAPLATEGAEGVPG